MTRLSARLLIVLTVALGGGSLLLFAYFLYFGAPYTFRIAHSDASRLAWDSALCLVFFLQHSGMIRPGAKVRIAKHVPASGLPALYSIASGIALLALVLLWQPTDEFLFGIHGPARWLSGFLALLAVAGFAWGVHSLRGFDPFGTVPLEATLRGTPAPSSAFVAQGPYRYVRHPLYLFMLLLIWSAPSLSTDQLLFNGLWTAWVVVGTRLEERDLRAEFGETYRQYQRSVPMLIPFLRRRLGAE